MDYCNSVYYDLPNTTLRKLQKIQNRAARLITSTYIYDRITPALITLHWLPIKARIIYKLCLMTYKTITSGLPKYLNDYLKPFKLETSMTLRHATEQFRFLEPRSNKKISDRAFVNCAPRLFNKLPSEVKESLDIVQFKKKLKTYLFLEAYDLDLKETNPGFKL